MQCSTRVLGQYLKSGSLVLPLEPVLASSSRRRPSAYPPHLLLSSALNTMNALYTHALRQTQSITSDLALLENSLRPPGSPSLQGDDLNGFVKTPSPSLQGNGVDTTGLNGQIVASLAALQRTVDDYENMAKKELVEANKGKAATSVPPRRDRPGEEAKASPTCLAGASSG